ncbi:Flagellar calcium-binding protein TB-44A [Durusdinium trenchii]|uniref:Flagellar calcium-binding protein TB-44A n=1 Tax=Durusdinium trenchii TaxID=1381693 RepID=A0ABP0LGS8_9DINO
MITRLWSNAVQGCRALQTARRCLHKAPGLPDKIYRPHVQEPEHSIKISGQPTGVARYIPKNFRHQQYIDSIRSAEYLGEDSPYNHLGGTFWKARRYNVTYNPIPADSSVLPGVHFHSRLNVWVVEWHEQERHRIKYVRASYGFMRAKMNAEAFRRDLVQAGRVDNRRTDRQIQIQQLARAESRRLFKKKFDRKDARRVGNSGSKKGNERKVRRDYQRRGLLP